MLIRAAVTSLLLHLLLLLSAPSIESGWPASDAETAGQRLRLTMTPQGGSDLSTAADKTEGRDAPASQAPARISGGAPRGRTSATMPPPMAPASPAAGSNTSPQPPAGQESLAELPPVPAELSTQYRLDIARRARHFKDYPPLARRNGWQGTVVVAVNWMPGQTAPGIVLENSSGHALLDRQALAMIEQAVNQVALPEGLRGRALRVSLPVVYDSE